jgi:photosystem II stability/assembly factor-like uncharacterized protein
MNGPSNPRRIVVLLALLSSVLTSSDARAVSYRWSNVPIPSPVGTVQALAVAPSDPSVVYADSGNGVFVSVDAGATWTRRSDKSHVLAFAVDPTNPSIVWAGSGRIGDSDRDSGLWKSTDGGASWTLLTVTPTGSFGQFPTYAVAIDSVVPSTVYAGTSVGLYGTTDGGATWTALTNGFPPLTNIFALGIAPSSHSTIYAGTAYGGGIGVFKSTDRGASWTPLPSGIPNTDVRALVVDPTDANVVYRSDYSVGISKTTDGGLHWTLVLPVRAVVAFAIDPTAPGTVYACLETDSYSVKGGLLKTTNGGATWAHSDSGLDGLVVRTLAIDPRSSSRLYAGSTPNPEVPPPLPAYSGVFLSSDGGTTWRPSSQHFALARFSTVTLDPRIPSTIFLDAMRSTDGGITWRPVDVNAKFFVFDPRNASTVYAGPPLSKSTDGGATWAPPTLVGLGAGVVGFGIDPATTSTFYAVSSNGVFSKSVDAGLTWTSTIFIAPIVTSFAIDPAIPRTLYAGTLTGLLESRDGGDSWFRVVGGWPELTLYGSTSVRLLGTDPATNAVYVNVNASGEGMYRSTDGGATWAKLQGLGGEYISVLTIDPSNGTLYAADNAGVVRRSTDNGASWTSVSGELPGGIISSLAIDPLSSTLWAVSGGLVYKATFLEDVSCLPDPSTLCLNASRFRVRAAWRTPDGSAGDAHARPDTSDTGAFWFFSANNIEVVVKVVDGRPANGKFWVFGAALTNVEYTLEITDTTTGTVWTHHNPQGQLASFADTTAF